MPHVQSKSFSQQLRVVVMSYVTRPGIRWALLPTLTGILAYWLARAMGEDSHRDNTFTILLRMIGVLAAACGGLGLIFMFFLHARRQLVGTIARLVPGTRTANTITAGALLILLAALMTVITTFGHHADSRLGTFAVTLGFLVLVGYSVARPILIPLFVVTVLLFRYTNFRHTLDHVSTDYGGRLLQTARPTPNI